MYYIDTYRLGLSYIYIYILTRVQDIATEGRPFVPVPTMSHCVLLEFPIALLVRTPVLVAAVAVWSFRHICCGIQVEDAYQTDLCLLGVSGATQGYMN